MIRINLLPFRKDRRREEIRRQFSTVLLGLVLTFAVLWLYTQRMDSGIQKQITQIQEAQTEIELHKNKAERVTQIKKNLKVLEEKLKIVNNLKSKRYDQLALVASLPDFMIGDKMWIENMTSSSRDVVIKGVAFDNPIIADFMKRLESSSFFSTVDLKLAQTREFKNGVNLKSFEVICRKSVNRPSPMAVATGK